MKCMRCGKESKWELCRECKEVKHRAGVQRVLDKMCEQETQRLRTELAEARVIAQNNQQTNELIARLSPTATPARLVNSPYTSIYPPTTTA